MASDSSPDELKRASSPQSVDGLLQVALSVVDEGGLEALTLRPLAGRAGVSVPTITHHLGPKDRILERLISHARNEDSGFQTAWRARAALLDPGDMAGRAALGEAAFRAWIEGARPRAILLWTGFGTQRRRRSGRNATAARVIPPKTTQV